MASEHEQADDTHGSKDGTVPIVTHDLQAGTEPSQAVTNETDAKAVAEADSGDDDDGTSPAKAPTTRYNQVYEAQTMSFDLMDHKEDFSFR